MIETLLVSLMVGAVAGAFVIGAWWLYERRQK